MSDDINKAQCRSCRVELVPMGATDEQGRRFTVLRCPRLSIVAHAGHDDIYTPHSVVRKR